MRVLITGAAGNLGSFLARHLNRSPYRLRLLVHRTPLAEDLAGSPRVEAVSADLAQPDSLPGLCRDVDAIVHFAGVLFAPRPERFLPTTNTTYVEHLVEAALTAKVHRFVLVSFPHVEGPTTPERPATGGMDAHPISVHAQTRLAAEKALFERSRASRMRAVALRSGLIYGRGVKMIEAGRRLMRRRLLPVWPEPTWIHLLALPDFLRATEAALRPTTRGGVFLLGDELPMTLQTFLDALAWHWGYPRPLRLPRALFPLAGALTEVAATLLRTTSPLTRDFIRIGMVPHVVDPTRMRRELLPKLQYPTLREGLKIL
ncbi:MAG TPA: NAD-dependent epimerase/dehydratase family protein [Anaerolineales bacterium]|nr:NAD-dependent epimerase/dehydratase family protein [Anaerolineales bacterium]